jgi:digeranylgeranylglycerophospholipid reductase
MESAVQVTASGLDLDPNTLYFYLGKDVAPEGYFWVFPKGKDIANIGLGISGQIGKKKSAVAYLNDFMAANYPHASILTQVVGGVPCMPTLDKIQTDGLILVGDAAHQTNPLSGGGIASGMIGGKIGGTIAGESIVKQQPEHLLTYQKAWMKRLGDRHKIFNRIKDGVFNFSDDQFNKLAETANKIPKDKLNLGSLFRSALLHNPALLIDVAKVFITK